MKVTIKKKMIKGVLSRLQGMAGRKTDIPETRNVLIQAAGKTIKVSGTDLESGYFGLHPADVEKDGAISVSSKKLFEIVREFPEEYIQMEEKDGRKVFIEGENISYSLLGFDPDNYPVPPFTTKAEEMIGIDEKRLREMIEKTNIVSPRPEDYRAHIVGTNVSVSREGEAWMFCMKATDSNRLNIVETGVSSGLDMKDGVLVPKKALHEVSRFLSGDGGLVRVGFVASFIVFEKAEETFYARVLEGDFPRVDSLLEERENESVVVAERERFLAMMKRVSILTSDANHSVMFCAGDGKISAEAENPEMGGAREEMEADVRGESVEVHFNPRFIIDALSIMGAEKACFCLRGANSAGIWHDDDDPGFTGLVMPVSG